MDSQLPPYLFPVLERKTGWKLPPALFWFSAIWLFFLILFPHNIMQGYWEQWKDSLPGFLASVEDKYNMVLHFRTVSFLMVFVVLLIPIVQSLKKARPNLTEGINWRKVILHSVIVFGGWLLLSPHFQVESLATVYGDVSKLPLAVPMSVFHKRFLMPALSWLLFLRGRELFFIFSLILSFLLVVSTVFWFDRQKTGLKWYELLSIGSSSFIFYNYLFPGYPDVMFFILLIMISVLPFTNLGQLAIVVLSMATHEGALFVIVPLAWFFMSRKQFFRVCILLGIYILFWQLSYRMNPDEAINMHNVDGKTGLEWLLLVPGRALLGVFMANKLLWVFILYGIFMMVKCKDYFMAKANVSILLFSIPLIVLAIDTSRLAGFTYFAIFFTVHYLISNSLISPTFRKIIFIANLLIPPIYIGLNNATVYPKYIAYPLFGG